MSTVNLFSTYRLGDLELPNRLVMAPMTRNRAGAGNVPGERVAEYYEQRATAGLLVTEATQVAPEGVGYANTPGIHSADQVRGWKQVTDRVHRAGGRIFLQLWHVGRISHPSLQPDGVLPVAPSAVQPAGQVYTPEGLRPFETPRPLATSEIPGVVAQFRHGARLAREAGFDGVELHGANGYLIDQFLRDGTNQRADEYGGPAARRVRFLLEVTSAILETWEPGRVGVRLSPSGTFNDMRDSNPVETFTLAVRELDRLEIGYLHLIEGTAADEKHGGTVVPTAVLRPHFRRTLIVNGGYDRDRAAAVLAAGAADLVAFGRPFLANPDLVRRYELGTALNTPDPATFYGGTEKGYTDYPALAGAFPG